MEQDFDFARLVAGIQQVRRERQEIKEVLGILRPYFQPIVERTREAAERNNDVARFDRFWTMEFLVGKHGPQLLFEVRADVFPNGSTWEYRLMLRLHALGPVVPVVMTSVDYDPVDSLTAAQVGAVHQCLPGLVMEMHPRSRADLAQIINEYGEAADREPFWG